MSDMGLFQMNYKINDLRASKQWLMDEYTRMATNKKYAIIQNTTGGFDPAQFRQLGQIHRLKIWCKNPDTGEDGWYGEYDWNIEHHQQCERRRWTMEEAYRARYETMKRENKDITPQRWNVIHDVFQYGRDQEIWTWECPLADHTNAVKGIDTLGPHRWEDLEEGTYDIVLEVAAEDRYHQQYGGRPDPMHYRIRLL